MTPVAIDVPAPPPVAVKPTHEGAFRYRMRQLRWRMGIGADAWTRIQRERIEREAKAAPEPPSC